MLQLINFLCLNKRFSKRPHFSHAGFGYRLIVLGQRHRRQNTDNEDNHQQFNECKTA